MSQYQTITPDKPGAYNTLDWFSLILDYIDFYGHSVIDWGCAEGVMTELAIENGASSAVGVDMDSVRLRADEPRAEYIHMRIEDFLQSSAHSGSKDISILSMIIHWLEDHDTLREILWRTHKSAVIIYREAHPGYKKPDNGYWFPDYCELQRFMDSCGFRMKAHRFVQRHDGDKVIRLGIFDRYKRMENREDGTVYKWNANYNYNWLNRLHKLQKTIHLPHLLEADIGYYITRKIDGLDLWGEKPFVRPWLAGKPDPYAKADLQDFIARLEQAFQSANLMLTDINRRNVIHNDEGFHLIDFDKIGLYDPNNDQWREFKTPTKQVSIEI